MLYQLEDKLTLGKNLIYGMQHVIYFVVSAVVMPVVVGTMLGLDQHELAGILPTVAFMPYVSSTGILAMTGVAARKPFVLAGVLMIGLGLFSPVGIIFASIPVSVGCAALMMIFALIFGQGVKELQKIKITNRESFILGISIIIGVGAMFLPKTAFREFPEIFAYLLPNGMVDGMLAALLLENLLPIKILERE